MGLILSELLTRDRKRPWFFCIRLDASRRHNRQQPRTEMAVMTSAGFWELFWYLYGDSPAYLCLPLAPMLFHPPS